MEKRVFIGYLSQVLLVPRGRTFPNKFPRSHQNEKNGLPLAVAMICCVACETGREHKKSF